MTLTRKGASGMDDAKGRAAIVQVYGEALWWASILDAFAHIMESLAVAACQQKEQKSDG